MENKMISLICIGIVAFFILIGIIGTVMTYNNMTSLSQECDSQWSKVETVYQERMDLIPNIVATVSSEVKTETTLLSNLANARANYLNSKNTNDKVLAAQEVDRTLFKVIALTENYPNLQFSKGYQELRIVLEGQENRVRVERNRFNDMVKQYNIEIKIFPNNMFAGTFGFKEKQYFKATAGAEIVPKVGGQTTLP